MKYPLRGKILLLLFSLLFLFPGSMAIPGQDNLSVRVLSRFKPLRVTLNAPRGNLFFHDKSLSLKPLSVTLSLQKGKIKIHHGKTAVLTSSPVHLSSPHILGVEFTWKGTRLQRGYPGNLLVYPGRNELIAVNSIRREIFIHSSAMAELGILLGPSPETCATGWQRELISAMEICIRSYLLHMKNRHEDPRYGFCDLTHCVHYPGTTTLRGTALQALTPGLVMLDDRGSALGAFFHAASGGILTGPEVFWPRYRRDSHYRRGRDTLGDGRTLSRKSPHEDWEAKIPSHVLQEIFRLPGIRDIVPVKRQQRISALLFTTPRGTQKIPVALFMSRVGKKLGWSKIKSNAFEIRKRKDIFIFTGKGLGHGIGMSQWSARDLACRGWTYRQILSYFYNNPEIVLWPR